MTALLPARPCRNSAEPEMRTSPTTIGLRRRRLAWTLSVACAIFGVLGLTIALRAHRAASAVARRSVVLDMDPGLWRLPLAGDAQASVGGDSGALLVDVARVDGVDWHVQCSQRGIALTEGATYTLRFRAQSDTPREIRVRAEVDQPDYHIVGLDHGVWITPDWRTYFCTFTAHHVLDNANGLVFVLGSKPGGTRLADVVLEPGELNPFRAAWASLTDYSWSWMTLGLAALGIREIASRRRKRRRTIRLLAAAVTLGAANYLVWRCGIVHWSCWWIAVPLLLAELFQSLHTVGFQYTVLPRKKLALNLTTTPWDLPIFVFIPTVNEGAAILEATIRGAQSARDRYLDAHPEGHVRIVVCNDGRVAGADGWRDTEALAAELGVECVTRTVRGGAKAGNIENARQQTGATGRCLLVVFDADQVADAEFLICAVTPFADPRVGWVQTPQSYQNLENPVARWAEDQQAIFYRTLCPGKASLNAAFICGTNVVIRAAALDEIGGLPQDSVTEDFAASILLHGRWKGVFLGDVLARGLGPMDLKSYFGQQRRWALGTLGALRTHFWTILLPPRTRRKTSLQPAQWIQYLLAASHYLCGLRDLIFLAAPIVFLVFGVNAVGSADVVAFLWRFGPYWLASQLALWSLVWGKASLRGFIMGFASFPVLLNALAAVILNRPGGFVVTAKRRVNSSVLAVLAPHILTTAICVAVIVGAAVSPGHRDTRLLSAAWVAYMMTMLLGIFSLALQDRISSRAQVPDMEDGITPDIPHADPPHRPPMVLRDEPAMMTTTGRE